MTGIVWHMQLQFIAKVTRDDGRTISVAVQSNGKTWGALAIESGGTSVDEILAEHRHRLLSKGFRSERAAKLAGERFMMTWAAGTESIADVACECHEASKPKKRSRPLKRHTATAAATAAEKPLVGVGPWKRVT